MEKVVSESRNFKRQRHKKSYSWGLDVDRSKGKRRRVDSSPAHSEEEGQWIVQLIVQCLSRVFYCVESTSVECNGS